MSVMKGLEWTFNTQVKNTKNASGLCYRIV